MRHQTRFERRRHRPVPGITEENKTTRLLETPYKKYSFENIYVAAPRNVMKQLLFTERAYKIAQMKLWAQKIAKGTKTDLQSLAWPPENNLFSNQSFANWCMDLLMITKKVLRLVLVRFFWFDRMDWQGRVICLDLQFLMFVENSDSDLIIGTIGFGEDRTSYRSAHILSADQESEKKICFGKLNGCWFKEEFHSFET